MLTTPTNGWDEDTALLNKWGLTGMQRSDEHFRKDDDVTPPVDVDILDHEAKLEREMMQSNQQETSKAEKEAQPQIWS